MEYVKEEGAGMRLFHDRLKFYRRLGFRDSQLQAWCKRFKYKPYIYEIITCETDEELFHKFPETWKFVKETLGKKYKRRAGRTCFATAKDLLMDGLITDIILEGVRHNCPTLKIRKNDVDSQLELNSTATHEPDFIVEVGGKEYYLEMKITKNKEDLQGRKQWSGNTLTIRPAYDGVKRELFNYSDYNTNQRPVMFLRINPSLETEQTSPMCLAVVGYHKFESSKDNDGSYYAFYRPSWFKGYNQMFTNIGEEIKKEIKDIEEWKKCQ